MICVDASVAAKWVLPEPYSPEALALVTTATRTSQVVVAPTLFPYAVTNTIRRHMFREALPMSGAARLLARFLAFPVSLMAPAGLHEHALRLASTYGLPAAYDAHYVSLAQTVGCDLWTDDQRLLRTLGDRLPFVKWIGDYAGARPR